MNKIYKVSDKCLKKLKSEAMTAYVLVSLMLVFFIPILLIDYWYIALPVGILLVPVWIHQRRSIYMKQMDHAIQSRLEIADTTLTFHYPNGKTEVDCQNPKRLDVNMKGGDIDSLLITMNADTKVFITGYEKIEEIKHHFIRKVGELNVKQHRWLHKLS